MKFIMRRQISLRKLNLTNLYKDVNNPSCNKTTLEAEKLVTKLVNNYVVVSKGRLNKILVKLKKQLKKHHYNTATTVARKRGLC